MITELVVSRNSTAFFFELLLKLIVERQEAISAECYLTNLTQ